MKKQLFFSNPGMKLFSLVLALVLWFSVSGGKEGFSFIQREVELKVPVRVLEPLSFTFQVKVEPEEVKLLLTGSREALKRVSSRDIFLFIPVERLKKGEYELPPQVYLPEGIKVSKSEPEVVKVILDDRLMTTKEPFPESLLKEGG